MTTRPYYAVIEIRFHAGSLTAAKVTAERLIDELKRGVAMPHFPVSEAALFNVERMEG